MKILLLLSLCISFSFSKEYDVFSIGHSLINFTMPQILEGIANDDTAVTHRHKEQIINGANLKWNWENNNQPNVGTDSKVALATGDYEILVMTEAVPLINHLTWSDTELYSSLFYKAATDANAETQVYMYETWHCINSGTATGCEWDDNDTIPWRLRLADDLLKWQGIVDSVNDSFPNRKPMLLIPAGQAMGALVDSIEAGNGAGLTDIADIYSDDIHPNDVGNYFVACVMYATMYKRSPEGLTHETFNEWGNPFEAPSQELATLMQKIAWEVVKSTPGTGVEDDGTAVVQHKKHETPQFLYAKNGELNIRTHEKDILSIYNVSGQKVQSLPVEVGVTIMSLSHLSSGVYVASLKDMHTMVIK